MSMISPAFWRWWDDRSNLARTDQAPAVMDITANSLICGDVGRPWPYSQLPRSRGNSGIEIVS
jgi:hypothetical protein